MSFEEMQTFLSNIQAERPETKMMNAILTCYQDIDQLKKMVIELQEKVNEIIENWNVKIENAAPVNQEEDIIDADIAAAADEVEVIE